MGRFRALGALSVMTSLLAVSYDGAAASCAPPSVTIDSRRARPGDVLRIRGAGWTDTCDDTGGGSVGSCSGSESREPNRPTQGIDVDVKRVGEPEWRRLVEDVNADDDLRIDVSVEVPDLAPGRYKVLVHNRGHQGYPLLSLRIAAP